MDKKTKWLICIAVVIGLIGLYSNIQSYKEKKVPVKKDITQPVKLRY